MALALRRRDGGDPLSRRHVTPTTTFRRAWHHYVPDPALFEPAPRAAELPVATVERLPLDATRPQHPTAPTVAGDLSGVIRFDTAGKLSAGVPPFPVAPLQIRTAQGVYYRCWADGGDGNPIMLINRPPDTARPALPSTG